MEREPEQALLASELDVASHVEEHRSLPVDRMRTTRPALLHDVERLRLAGGVRHEHRCCRTHARTAAAETHSRSGLPLGRRLRTPRASPARRARATTRTRTHVHGSYRRRVTGVRFALDQCGSSSSARARSVSPIVDALHHDHEITVLDTEPSRLAAVSRTLRRRDRRGRRDEPARPRRRGGAERRSRHRLHVAGRGQSRRRDVRASRGRRRDDGDPHVERRVRGALARRSAGRRLRRLLRARDRPCDQPDHRRSRPPARRTSSRKGRFRSSSSTSRRARRRTCSEFRCATRGFPRDSKVAAIIRGDQMLLPGGDEAIRPATASSSSARPRRRRPGAPCSRPEGGAVRDVVIYGAGRVGSAIARVLLDQGIRVRLIEASREKARSVAEALPQGARLQRDRGRSRLPRARADRARERGDLRDARRREEPLRRVARRGARRPVHDRDRPRARFGRRRSSTPESTSR